MRELRLSYLFLSTVFIFFSFSSAWPWPPFDGLVAVKRQESGSNSESATPTSNSNSEPSSRPSSQTDSSRPATITSRPTPTDSESASESSSSSESNSDESKPSGSQTKDSNSTSSTIEIDPRLPQGGIQMITPAPLSGAQYYKIGDKLTFGWNYTSLSVTPKAIDIMASCSENHHIYTIAQNRSVESSQAITWDTQPQATADTPLVMASYTLLVYDSEKGFSAAPSAGYLGSQSQLTFAMYSPKPYTPLPSYQCASCSGASSQQKNLERQALGFMLGMVAITITSFTWFVSGVLF